MRKTDVVCYASSFLSIKEGGSPSQKVKGALSLNSENGTVPVFVQLRAHKVFHIIAYCVPYAGTPSQKGKLLTLLR